MDLKFIKKAKFYYAVDNASIEKALLVTPPITDKEALDLKNISEIKDNRKCFLDKMVVRGIDEFINPIHPYRITTFNYVTDGDVIEELADVYNQYLNRKKNNVCFQFETKTMKNNKVKVIELGDNSTAILEIHYVDTNA